MDLIQLHFHCFYTLLIPSLISLFLPTNQFFSHTQKFISLSSPSTLVCYPFFVAEFLICALKHVMKIIMPGCDHKYWIAFQLLQTFLLHAHVMHIGNASFYLVVWTSLLVTEHAAFHLRGSSLVEDRFPFLFLFSYSLL